MQKAFFLVVCALALAACQHKGETEVAEVEGRKLFLRDLIPERGPDSLNITQDMLRERILRWVDREALYHEALRRKLDHDPKVVELLEDARSKILVDQLIRDIRDSVREPSEGEVDEYYRRHNNEFLRTAPSFRLFYVLSSSLAEAQALREGARTLGLAAIQPKINADLNKAVIQPQGWIDSDSCFASELPVLLKGMPSSVKQCLGSYTFAYVLDRQDSGSVRPLEDVMPKVREKVRTAILDKMTATLLQDAKSRIVITTDLSPLKQYSNPKESP